MCDPAKPLATSQKFSSRDFEIDEDDTAIISDEEVLGDYGDVQTPTIIACNHYGNSDLRKLLIRLSSDTNYFSEAEQTLMMNETVSTLDFAASVDFKIGEDHTDGYQYNSYVNYLTSDKLYVPYGPEDDEYITVGAAGAYEPYGNIKVGILPDNASSGSPYTEGDDFWLRTPMYNPYGVSYVTPGTPVTSYYTKIPRNVVPVLRLNVSSVLFASTASASRADAAIDAAGGMTLRYDSAKDFAGNDIADRITSSATANSYGITVNNATAGEYLYIQWNDGTGDVVKSFALGSTTYYSAEDIGITELSSDCRIWIEKSDAESNITFAKNITYTPHTHDFSGAWTVTKEPAATVSGRREQLCTGGCGLKRVEEIPATGVVEEDSTNGNLSKYAEVEENAPVSSASLDNSKTSIAQSSIFEDDEKTAIEGGADAKVYLKITPIEDIDESDQNVIKQEAETELGTSVKVEYMDVSLFKQVGTNAEVSVHEPGIEIEVSIEIPQKMLNSDNTQVRKYRIIRLHEGISTVIKGDFD
jgi:hypothetical protein